MQDKSAFIMRSGGFGAFPKGAVSGTEAHLGPPPPETEPALISAWVSGEPWVTTGFSVRFPPGAGISDQEMMDIEIAYASAPETVLRMMEFPGLSPDPEAADAFRAMTPLLKPGPSDPPTPPLPELVSGFAAAVGEVIRTYAPKHAIAIGAGGGEFVAGPKLGSALRAFSGLLSRSLDLNGDAPELPAADGAGAYFIAPGRSVDLRALMDRAAFRAVMMGETVPRALGVAVFEARHALDERLSGSRLPAQESWDAMLASPEAYFLSPDRDLVGRMGAEAVANRKPARPERAPEPERSRDAPPADLWGVPPDGVIDDENPASFGL